jgi:hypothetical protein
MSAFPSTVGRIRSVIGQEIYRLLVVGERQHADGVARRPAWRYNLVDQDLAGRGFGWVIASFQLASAALPFALA